MKILLILVVMGLAIVLISFQSSQRTITDYMLNSEIVPSDTLWTAPDEANALVNPMESDEENLEEGEALYRKHCRSCHGKLGDGKGAGAADLKTTPIDFALPDFQNQSDGSMFWKIMEGKDEMESYKKKMSEEEVWLTVIYLRSFASSE